MSSISWKRNTSSEHRKCCILQALKDLTHVRDWADSSRKHMYIDKFKAWGVTKQYRAADTQQLALQITAAVLNDQPLESITHRGRPVNLKKVLRHMTRSDRRGRDVKRARKRAVKPEPEDLAEKADDSAPITPTTSPDESLSQSVSDLSSSNETQLTIYTPPHQTGSSHGASRTSTSPAPRSMTSSPGTGNLETILFDIGAFLSSDWTVTDTQGLPRTMFSHPGDNNHNPRYATLLPNTSPFFDEVKSAVYFLRSDSPHLAWPVLQEACDEASKSPFYPDRPFLVDLLAVLSPAKTKNHSSVRTTLLHFLAILCATRLGISHPLASICQQLAHDQATSSDIPVRALSYMHDLCSQNDSEPHPRNPTTKIQRALISIVRRDSDLDTAKRLAISAVEYCKSTLGHCHETTEQAMMELVYVQTYQGDYQTGLETCNEVLRSKRLRLGAALSGLESELRNGEYGGAAALCGKRR